MKTITMTRGLLAITAWVLLPVSAWALPPCTLCPWLTPGHLCFDANGDLDYCPFLYAAADEAVTIANFGFEIGEPGHFIGFEPGEDVVRASTVLNPEHAALVTVRNPRVDDAIEVQVRTRARDGSTRTVAVELAASGHLTFDLQPAAIYLLATSRSAFELELEDPKSLERTRLSPSLPFLKLGAGGDCDENENPGDPCDPDPPGGSVLCETDWTLTCDTSRSPECANLGPYTHAGKVKLVGTERHVYWNLNTPTGDYTTKNPQGLTAIWRDAIGDPDLCPNRVENSLGHWYNITLQ